MSFRLDDENDEDFLFYIFRFHPSDSPLSKAIVNAIYCKLDFFAIHIQKGSIFKIFRRYALHNTFVLVDLDQSRLEILNFFFSLGNV